MRAYVSLALCSALALPGAALAQDVLTLGQPATTVAPVTVAPHPAPTMAPLPTMSATQELPPATTAKPPPAPVAAGPAPEAPTGPTTVAPVLVEKDEGNGLGGKVGTVAAGMAVGAAGAAVAGPVGKFAGAFIGKRLARGIFGKDDGIPEVTVAEVPPSAETAGTPAVAAPAAAPPLKETVANPT